MSKKIHIFTSLLVLFFSLAVVSFGQETTGSIEGVVKDNTGAVVPGITVTIRSTGSSAAFRRQVTTKNDGSFVVQRVPPGTYKVVSDEDKGFGTATISNIGVSLGKASAVVVVVKAGGTTGVVDINATDSSQIDVTDQKIQTNIGQQQIESVPKGTNFTSLLKIAPAVRVEPIAGGFQIDGASGSENAFVIDGQEVTNFNTGVLNTNNNLPFQLIQEVQVKSSGFEAEHGGATGGVINVVTKGGNNEFHGEVGISFDPRKWRGDNRPTLLAFTRANVQMVEYFETPKDRGTNFFPSISLGGPIVKDHLWFFGSYTPQFIERERTINSLSGRDPQTRTLVESNTYRFRQKNEYAFGRIDAAITDRLRVNGSYTWNPIGQEGRLPSVLAGLGGIAEIPEVTFPDGTTLVGPAFNDQRGGRQTSNITNIRGTWTATDNFILHARYGYSFLNQKLGNYGIPPVGAPRYLCSISSTNIPGEAGCNAGDRQGVNASEVRFDASTRTTFDLDGSFFVNAGGRHALKVGYQLNRIANKLQQANTPLILIRYGDNLNSISNRPLTVNPNAIGAGFLQRFGRAGDVSSKNQSIYAQDKFQIGSKLTLSLGFRIEKEGVPSFVEGLSGIDFNWADKFTPRIGGAYDLTGDGKNKIYANWGWFHDRFKYQLPRGSFGGAFFRRDYFEVFPGDGTAFNFSIAQILGSNVDKAGGDCPVPGGIANSSGITACQRDFRAPSNIGGEVLEQGGIDPNLKPFRQSEITVGYERQLSRNYVFSSRYTHKQVDRAVEDLGFLNSSGSEVFLIGNPGLGLARQTFLDSGLVPLKARREYDAFEIRLDKRLSNNFYFNASYTYSRLFGNYGGLASSDEGGRNSPNVNRNFDSPISGFSALGRPDDGRLGTDRPNVFKLFGGYDVKWSGTNTTSFTGFQNISSGVPVTTVVNVLGIGTIPLNGRGDLGRTTAFSQTDFGIRHTYKFGKDGKFKIIAELDVINLFDEENETSKFRAIAPSLGFDETDFISGTADAAQDLIDFLQLFQTTSTSERLNQLIVTGNAEDVRYNLSNGFQGPRTVRFGFRFIF